MQKVFVLGPGYVGREIIDLLLAEGGYQVTTLVRREEAKKELEADGIAAVFGDLNDSTLITSLVTESDIVFHTATADHLESAQAMIQGVKIRASRDLSTIYLHQSGSSCLSDVSEKGVAVDFLNPKIYSDERPEEIDALPMTAPHRAIDTTIVKARQELGDKAKIFIMMPAIIYGVSEKNKRLSIQIPTLTRFAIKHGYAGYVGNGEAAWSTIHVLDLARAYITILHWAEKNSDAGLTHPYFFCSDGEMSWKQISEFIGHFLHKAGRLDSPDAKSIPDEEYGDLFGEFTADVVGCNSRCVGDRVRKLGWEPSKYSGSVEAMEMEDMPMLLAEKGFKASGLSLK